MHILKTEEEKRVATNRRILEEFPFLWALQEKWDLPKIEMHIHSLKNAGECYNLETILDWQGKQFPVKVWLYFTSPTTIELAELSPSDTIHYWQSALNEEWERYRSGMRLTMCIVVHYKGSSLPVEIDVYRFPKERKFFLELMGKAQMHR